MTQRFGNFEIIRKIAAGGMAEVYLAKHTGLGGFERLVCIKKILPHLGEQEEFIKMFQDEARIAANVIHPNIAQIYDIGEADDTYYIAMEYVRGEDLRRVYNQEVSRGRAMPGEQAAQIVMYAAAGLDYAHRQSSIDGRPLGIVHRDISPQNVLVSYDGHVKIVDFGVAKAQGKLAETRAGVLKGKYSYMSPEQASGDPIDGRTDVFALGITLYEVTTGTRLFKRESEIETLHAVIDCDVRIPRDVNPSYDSQLEAIVLKALQKRPEDRFATAGDMERALERYLIDRGYPTGASSLADYMHDLFAEKLADDMLFGGSVSSSEPRHEDDHNRPVTRALTPSAQRSHSSWGAGISGSGPATVEDENTIAEDEQEPAPRRTEATSAAGSGSWASHSGWSSVKSQPESQTQTHAVSYAGQRSAAVERPVMMQHQVTEPSNSYSDIVQRSGRNRPSPLVVLSIAAVIIALIVSVTMVLVSQRSGPESVPRSGPLIVDSEPRGARVLFQGYGSQELNDAYGGARTPFTIDEGIAVGAILQAEFIRDGFATSTVEVPQVTEGEVPPALFAELVPDTEANKAVLSFSSEPSGADVYVGGHKLEGTTPLEERKVTARQLHRIEIRLEGYAPHVESVYVEPGGRELISAYLRPKDEETPNAGATDAPPEEEPELVAEPEPSEPEEPTQTRSNGRAPPPRRRAKGFLKVDAPIPMKVYAGGRLLGQTPLRRESLPTGSARLRFESPSEGFFLTRRVRIRSGETAELALELQKGNVAVQATPWARVRRGSKAPVETPTRLTGLFEGEYRLRFECPDGSTRTEIARVSPGNTSTLSVDCRSN